MRSFWIIFCQIKFKSTKIRIKSLQNKDVQNLKLLQIIITPNDYHNQPYYSILLKKRYRTTLFQIYSNWLNFLIPNSLNKYLIPNYPFLNRLHRFPVVRINEKCRLERRRYGCSRNKVRFIVNRGKPSKEMKWNGDPFSRIKGARTSRANRFAGRESPGGIGGALLARCSQQSIF